MPRYAVPRITVGPHDREIKIEVARTLNVTAKFDKVELFLKRRKCGDEPTYKIESYAVCNGVAHFRIPDEFLKSDVLKGFYDVEVFVDGGCASKMELVKAPSHYVVDATTVETSCSKDEWEEPPCEDDTSRSPCDSCGCMTATNNGCPTCCDGESRVIVAEANVTEYVGDD